MRAPSDRKYERLLLAKYSYGLVEPRDVFISLDRTDDGNCTSVAAQWCPKCGDCICLEEAQEVLAFHYPPTVEVPELDFYTVEMNHPRCPLHAPDSPHAT